MTVIMKSDVHHVWIDEMEMVLIDKLSFETLIDRSISGRVWKTLRISRFVQGSTERRDCQDGASLD